MFISFVGVGLCISGLVKVLLKVLKCCVGTVSVLPPMFQSMKLLVGGSHVFLIHIMVSSGAEC